MILLFCMKGVGVVLYFGFSWFLLIRGLGVSWLRFICLRLGLCVRFMKGFRVRRWLFEIGF